MGNLLSIRVLARVEDEIRLSDAARGDKGIISVLASKLMFEICVESLVQVI